MISERRGIGLRGGKKERRTREDNSVCVMEIQEDTVLFEGKKGEKGEEQEEHGKEDAQVVSKNTIWQ